MAASLGTIRDVVKIYDIVVASSGNTASNGLMVILILMAAVFVIGIAIALRRGSQNPVAHSGLVVSVLLVIGVIVVLLSQK